MQPQLYLKEQKDDSNETIEDLVKIFNDTASNGCVQIYLSFIKIHAQKFIDDLNFFQQENLPLFPFIEGRLEQLNVYINNGITLENFGEPLTTFIQNLNFTLESFQIIFRSTYNAAFKKFREHILTHPCCELFKAAQIFDPRFTNLISNWDILFYSISIVKFANPSYNLI